MSRPFNRDRFFGLNYGLIDIDWADSNSATTILLQVVTENNVVMMKRKLVLGRMQPHKKTDFQGHESVKAVLQEYGLEDETSLVELCNGESRLPFLRRHRLKILGRTPPSVSSGVYL